MRELVMIPFEVHEGKIAEAKVAIREFIEHIRAKEPGTLFYTSLQDQENPKKFVHFIIFADNAAHQLHRDTPHVHEFVSKLYPVCVEEPAPIFLEEFDSCGVVTETLTQSTSK